MTEPTLKKVKTGFPAYKIIYNFMQYSPESSGAITFSYQFDNTDEMVNQAVEILKTKLGDKGLFLTKKELNDDEILRKHFLTADGKYNYDTPIRVIVLTTPRKWVEDSDSDHDLKSYFSGCTVGLKRLTREEKELVEDEDEASIYEKYYEPWKDENKIETMETQLSRVVNDLISSGCYIGGIRIGKDVKEEEEVKEEVKVN